MVFLTMDDEEHFENLWREDCFQHMGDDECLSLSLAFHDFKNVHFSSLGFIPNVGEIEEGLVLGRMGDVDGSLVVVDPSEPCWILLAYDLDNPLKVAVILRRQTGPSLALLLRLSLLFLSIESDLHSLGYLSGGPEADLLLSSQNLVPGHHESRPKMLFPH